MSASVSTASNTASASASTSTLHFPLSQQQLQKHFQHAYGAIMGAFVGDALGAYLEFSTVNEQTVKEAMKMPGGGVWKLAPGQITDDSELALCLARGLVGETKQNDDESIWDAVAHSYGDWFKSHPFDIGNTCRNAFGLGNSVSAKKMTAHSMKVNIESGANGAMMRATPIPISAWCKSDQDIALMAYSDAQLSHPNPQVQIACAAYSIAIAALIRTKGDKQDAIARAQTYLDNIYHANLIHPNQQLVKESRLEVLSWFQTALNNDDPHGNCRKSMGWVKWAFTESFRHLQLETPYVDAIAQTLAKGGDTDTNAAIVGGMIGAFHGIGAIDEEYQSTVLKCKPHHGRPHWLYSKQVPELCQRLFAISIPSADSSSSTAPSAAASSD